MNTELLFNKQRCQDDGPSFHWSPPFEKAVSNDKTQTFLSLPLRQKENDKQDSFDSFPHLSDLYFF